MTPFDRLREQLGLTSKRGAKKPAKKREAKTPAAPKAAQFLDLEGSDLVPLTSDELRDELENLILSGGFRVVGRGAIPTDDERSKLINRAMVGQGILTPEQLAEIIRVAGDHEKLEKALVVIEKRAAKAADAAVKADREARAKLKEKKKAEAAERKRRHAGAVAERKATDIIFLGKGVSARLNDRQSDAEALESRGLPVLHTPADVAAALGLTVPRLRWLAFHNEATTRVHYVFFAVPKRSGGTRILSAPHKTLSVAQQWVYANVVSKLPVLPEAHGFVPGRNVVTNAEPHVGKAVVVNLDLQDFFPSVTFVRVRSVFQRAGYSGAVATVLALLCTECPREAVEYAGTKYFVATAPRGLPQGACTSPGLSNQVARRLDKRLGGLARKLGLTYTRYADDLTFSGGPEFNEKVGYLMARVRHIAQEEGFAVNEDKSRVLRRNTAQTVTGVVVNEKPSLPREELRRLRAILHQAGKDGLDAQNRQGLPHFRSWLRGKIAYVKMVRPDLGSAMLAELDRLEGKGTGAGGE